MINSGVGRGLGWLIKKIGIETIIPFSLLLIIFLSLVFGLRNILIRFDGNKLATPMLVALLTGWLMGRSRLKNPIIFMLLAITGFFFVLVHSLNLWALLLLFLAEALTYAWRVLLSLADYPFPDPSVLFLLWGDISFETSSVLAKISRWLLDLYKGVPNYDIQTANFLWGLALWLTAGWAAWRYRRTYHALTSLLPAGVLITSSLSFARGSVYFLVPIIAGLLFLLAWDQFNLLQAEWQERQTDVAEDIIPDMVMWISAVSVTVIILSLFVSVFSTQKLFQTLRDFAAQNTGNSQEIGEALGLQQEASGASYAYSDDPGILPRSHLIGAPPELSKQLALIVQINSEEDVESDSQPDEFLRENLYFKSITFDQYTGRGWRTSPTREQNYDAGEILLSRQLPGQLTVTQSVQYGLQPGGVLYYTGLPLQVSQAHQVESRDTGDNQLDLYAIKSRPTSEVNQLEIVSVIPLAGEAQLRAANQAYPQWILDRYLQLPAALPAQVHELARQITQDQPTVYDKAKAIETYLRGYSYSLEIPPPPDSGDISAYFLFEQKSGYCDYFATAMTVLARSAGIPARLVIGYASGLYDSDKQRYIITAADAHSWVEIYFPGIGWIEFEPTAALESINRLSDSAIENLYEITPIPIPENEIRLTNQSRIYFLAALAAFFSIILLLSLIEKYRLARLSPRQTSLIIYQRFVNQAKHLNIQSQPNPTPNEWLNDFSSSPEIQLENNLYSRLIRLNEKNIKSIIQNYNLASYSPFSPNKDQQAMLIRAWLSIRNRLLLARLWKKFNNRFVRK